MSMLCTFKSICFREGSQHYKPIDEEGEEHQVGAEVGDLEDE
jgi:hypothetical protein